MLLTIEKVAVLKEIDLFAGVPGYALGAVAQVIDEVSLEPGEQVLTEGNLETWMFVIIEGEVRVHSQGRTIVHLGPGETIGELAVLDPEPRSASVTTLSDVLLFRLDGPLLKEIMVDQPVLAEGIIRALCRRIRKQGRFIASEPWSGAN